MSGQKLQNESKREAGSRKCILGNEVECPEIFNDRLSNNMKKIIYEYNSMCMSGDIPVIMDPSKDRSILSHAIKQWAVEFENTNHDKNWENFDYDLEIRKFARCKLLQFFTERFGNNYKQKVEDFSDDMALSQNYVVKLIDNVIEIMEEYHAMLHQGEISPADNFAALKEAAMNWAIQFEREYSDIDWIATDYSETIGIFARQRLFPMLREDKVFYTDEWSTEDIFNIADDMEIFLSPEELKEIVKLSKEAFENKTNQMEMITGIIENVIKKRESVSNT